MNTIEEVIEFELRNYKEERGTLIPVEYNSDIPFNCKRSFYVLGNKGDIRGKHAHHKCDQVLTSLAGSINVRVYDGKQSKTVLLDKPGKSLMIPAGIWAEQQYQRNESVLAVFCSMRYARADYIRNFEEFNEWVASNG
jgi:dTDP-4-dehydrorhamnose 3,5-epimerase-like enzyme